MPNNRIKLGPGFSFESDGVSTQTFGVLAVRGAGKSNLAAVMAEEMYGLGLPFVVVDPVGSWWGLRSSGDGKTAGLQIPIFGGRHGDVPLEKTGGHLIADLVVDERASCILDISEMSEGDKIRFLIDFAERLYRRNTEPLHLFLEEADDYCPQRPMREQARLLRAWENVVRRGRGRGLGMTMITQRSAALNKNVLTQIETLFVLRTTSPQDRKAIAAWVEYQGQSKELLESLPSLKPGEAWMWSPQWLRTMKHLQIRLRHTFDSGATPKHRSGTKPAATMADVDLAKVRKLMVATIERAKQDDPRELRKQIGDLRKELAATGQVKQTAPCGHEDQIKGLDQAIKELNTRLEGIRIATARAFGSITNSIDTQIRAGSLLIEAEIKKLNDLATADPPVLPVVHINSRPNSPRRQLNRRPATAVPVSHADIPDVPRSHRRLLDGLAWFEAFGQQAVSQQALAGLCGMSWKGGAFQKYRSALRTADLVDYRDGSITLTDRGRLIAEPPAVAPTLAALHETWLSVFPNSHRKILSVLIESYPRSLTQQETAEAVGMAASGGAFQKYRSKLKTLGAVEYIDGRLKASELLFPEGLR
jgi:hypothetical protein